ncbi:MAG: PEGA domain-containing protein [Candidatus Aminicenantia bacterium]
MKNLKENGYFKLISTFVLFAFFAVFVISASFNSPLRAQQTDIDKILEEGKKAYLEGEYDRAIQLLNQAIALIKNKSTLVDAHLSLALTYFTVNQLDNCIDQIKSILKLNPSFKPDPEFYSPKFLKLFEKVKNANTRIVTINSIPQGATIFIDDENKGFTPFKGELYTETHKIKVLKEGFEPVEKEIDLSKEKRNLFELALNPSIPAETKVTPVEEKPKEVKPEEKVIEEKPVFKEREEKVEKKKSYTLLYVLGGALVAGVVVALLLSKKEGKGSISVNSTPTGAKIFLDGADTGKMTNAVLTDVKAGSHTITLKKSLFQDWSTTVNVSKNQTTNVNAELLAAPFIENFNDGVADHWKSYGPGEWKVIGGQYRFKPDNTGSYCFTWYDVGDFKDFTFQAEIVSYVDQCLTFRGDTTGTMKWYLFYVWQKTQEWAIIKIEGSSLYSLKSYEYSSAIKQWPNWNNLKVVVSGTNFTFYINGVKVGSISDASYSKGKVGVYTRDFDDYVWVDNVSVSLSTAGSFAGEPVIPILVSPEQAFKKIIK